MQRARPRYLAEAKVHAFLMGIEEFKVEHDVRAAQVGSWLGGRQFDFAVLRRGGELFEARDGDACFVEVDGKQHLEDCARFGTRHADVARADAAKAALAVRRGLCVVRLSWEDVHGEAAGWREALVEAVSERLGREGSEDGSATPGATVGYIALRRGSAAYDLHREELRKELGR